MKWLLLALFGFALLGGSCASSAPPCFPGAGQRNLRCPAPLPTPTSTPQGEFATAVPRITQEPSLNAAATVPLIQSDSIVDGIAIDLGTNTYPNLQGDVKYLCAISSVNVGGQQVCFRHMREGGTFSNAQDVADDNFLAAGFGIDDIVLVNAGDTDAQITALPTRFIALAGVLPPNEPDGGADAIYAYVTSASPTNGATLAAPIGLSNFYNLTSAGGQAMPGKLVYVGEGPTQETMVVLQNSGSGNGATAFANAANNQGFALAHEGGVNLSTTTATAGAANPTAPPFPSPYGTPLDYSTPPPTPTPGSAATPFALPIAAGQTNTAAILPSDYVTLHCGDAMLNREVAQVAPSYTPGPSNTTLPLVAPPYYAHNSGENIVEGCVERVTQWEGDAIDQGLKIAQIWNDLHNIVPLGFHFFTGSLCCTAGQQFAAVAGGYPLVSGTWNTTQLHGYQIGANPGGGCNRTTGCLAQSSRVPVTPGGSGIGGAGNPHTDCFRNYAIYASFVQVLCTAYMQGGQYTPIWGTEMGLGNVVPIGSPGSGTGYTSVNQQPDDVAVKELPRLFLYDLTHGYQRVYQFALFDGPGGFCTYGLIRDGGCGASGGPTAPKADYLALMDTMALYTDNGCRYPGCSFTPDPITFGWSTQTDLLRSVATEKSDGSILFAYWSEGQDYLYDQTAAACYATTSCYQQQAPFSETLQIAGAHAWSSSHSTYDATSGDGNYGHIQPFTAGPTFNASDQTTVSVTDTIQYILLTNTGFHPVTGGQPTPRPTLDPNAAVTPEPISIPTLTPIP